MKSLQKVSSTYQGVDGQPRRKHALELYYQGCAVAPLHRCIGDVGSTWFFVQTSSRICWIEAVVKENRRKLLLVKNL